MSALKRIESRAALLAKLETVFETRGYEGATLTQLAEASGLGKASLYHHFPGGKAEMAAVLLRDAVARLETRAFSRLNAPLPPGERLRAFADGFADYTEHGARNCLVAVLAQGSAQASHGLAIADRYAEWLRRLAATFEAAGDKPKAAERRAAGLLAALYGYLVTARLLGDSGYFRRGVKRLKKSLPG